MRLSGVNLANVEAGFIGEGEIATIAGDGGGSNAIVQRIGGQLRHAGHGRPMLLGQQQSEFDPNENEYDRACRCNNPPNVKTKTLAGGGFNCGGYGMNSVACIHRRKESIAPARHGLHKPGILGGVSERVAHSPYGGVQAVIEVDERISRP